MGPIPLDPAITPRIELNHKDPVVYLLRDEDWTCPDCEDHYCLDEEGKDRVCVVCAIKRSGKSSITLFGWKVMKTSGQVIAQPPTYRIDGN